MKNIMMDVAFTIETTKEFEELTQAEVVSALLKRVAGLLENWEPEAIGFCDSYDLEDYE